MTLDNRWIAKNLGKLMDDYGGRYVAVVNEKVVAAGARPDLVEARAQKLTGARTPAVVMVPAKEKLASHRFDYSVFRDAKAPVIPVEVWGAGRWHNLWVYVDSGASFSVFHIYEAKRLGVKLSRCEKFFLTVAGGRVPVYQTRLRLKIGSATFHADVGFCSVLGGAFNLLGRQGVFDQFAVTFDDRNETVTFDKSKKRSLS